MLNRFISWRRGALAGTALAIAASLGLAGCDLSSITGAGTQCTPQTCDYVVNTLVVVGGSGSVTLLADSQSDTGTNALYQYSGSQWNKLGSEDTQSRGTLLASPNFASDQTLYMGNLTSKDGGKTFTPLCVTTIGVSPNFASDKTVFGKDVNNTPSTSNGTPVAAPTGCPAGAGAFYISKNSGQSWTTAQGPAGAGDPDQFVVSPTYKSDNTLFATFTIQGASALYKSSNGGQSWSRVLDNRQDAVAVSPSFSADKTVAAVASDGVRISTNGGQGWQTLTTPIDPTQIKELAFSPAYAQDHTIALVSAAIDQGSTAQHGTFTSTDGGKTWKQASQLTQRGQNAPALVFSPNYATDHTIYTSSQDQGKGPASSTDLGQNWTTINTGLTLQAGLGG